MSMIHNKTRAREQGVETHLTNLPHTDFLCRSCGCRLCWPSGSSMELWLLLWDRRGGGKSMSSRSLYRSGGPKAKDRLSLELWLPILSCVTPSLLQGNHTYIRYITGMLCYKQRILSLPANSPLWTWTKRAPHSYPFCVIAPQVSKTKLAYSHIIGQSVYRS
jgi:hypothetical protein